MANADFNGLATRLTIHGEKLGARLQPFIEQNKRRRPCPRCGNIVLPEKMDQHVRVYHS